MSALLGLIIFLLFCCILWIEYTNKSASVFLWATLFVMFGIPHFITTIYGSETFNTWVIDTASLFVIVFCFLYLSVRILFLHKFTININTVKSQIVNKKFIRIFLLLFILVIGTKIYNIYSISGNLLDSSWGSTHINHLNASYFSMNRFIYAMLPPVSGILLLFLLVKKKKDAYILTFILVFNVLVSRNRTEVLPILISYIWYVIFMYNNLNIKVLMKLLGLGCMSIFCVYGLLIFRYAGTIDAFINNFEYSEFSNAIGEHLFSGKGEVGLREVFYYFIRENNRFENFGEGHTYLRMLLVFLPTQWSLGLKPPDFAISMGAAYMPGVPGFSTHPTLFGDCYANFGFLGCSLGIFWASFVTIADLIICRSDKSLIPLLLITFSCCFVVIGRGSVYNGFYDLCIGIVFLFIVYNVFIKTKYVFGKSFDKYKK